MVAKGKTRKESLRLRKTGKRNKKMRGGAERHADLVFKRDGKFYRLTSGSYQEISGTFAEVYEFAPLNTGVGASEPQKRIMATYESLVHNMHIPNIRALSCWGPRAIVSEVRRRELAASLNELGYNAIEQAETTDDNFYVIVRRY